MTPDAFHKFIAAQRGKPVEIIAGLHKPNLAAGALTDAEVKPGEPLRAGGYAEDRSIYTQPLFAPAGEEPRTIHLGVDIFAPAGADVFAPLPGRVHSAQINDHPGDYGPTIILEHTSGSEKFHTLYGHLSRDSLKGLKPGAAFMAGEPIAQLGTKRENGGWPPHLHFQVLLDIGKAKGDYPGVCKRSERERWLAICPDPRPLLGLRAS
jgi:murein DD-endopeptidase MepM/ murein hydrolase activator NlpD